jgi:L-asparaginase II
MPGTAPLSVSIDVDVRRGGVVESRHRVHAAVTGPLGEPFATAGDAHAVTTFRSAAKPFQLLPLVERGHADRWGYTDEHLAVMAASHTGSRRHLALVAEILERIGLSDRHLACGYHDPLDPESLAWVRTHPDDRSPLFNNCSGKHAGMLSLAIAEGWPVAGYELPDHPVQRLLHETVAAVCGEAVGDVAVAVDGCSAPVFVVPLSRMARAYARFAVARAGGDARDAALHRIQRAMTAHPRLSSGAGRFSAALMEATGGRVVSKGGAEGLECVAFPSRGLGLALKVEDGQSRAVGPAALELLEAVGLLEPAVTERLQEWRRPVVRNHAGRIVGQIVARASVATPQPC